MGNPGSPGSPCRLVVGTPEREEADEQVVVSGSAGSFRCSPFAARICPGHSGHCDGRRGRAGRLGVGWLGYGRFVEQLQHGQFLRWDRRIGHGRNNDVERQAPPAAAPRTRRAARSPAFRQARSTARGTGNSQAAEVTVNYITPSAPGGIKGLAAGVDPETNHYVNDNNVRYSGSQTIKNTPDVSVGGPASGPCNGFSGGVGVSVPGFAIGANASTVDKGCEARETARIAAMLGRMDIANAVLEHIGVVEEALKAKAEREAAKKSAMAVPAAPVAAAGAAQQPQPQQPQPQQQQQEPQQPQQSPTEAELEAARLAEQQKLAVAALQRKATMDKVNDTITFTTAANQEKTPQQTMAEEAISSRQSSRRAPRSRSSRPRFNRRRPINRRTRWPSKAHPTD